MNTLIIVLSAVVGQAGEEITPPLQRDYTQAKQRAAQEMKPMAVFLVPGQQGLGQVIPGGLPTQVRQILADKYVTCLIDTGTPQGQQLARTFGIQGNQGFVISDRGGTYQAFWQQGAINTQDLIRSLQRFANVNQIQVTMVAGRTSFYPDEYQQMQQAPPTGYYNGASYSGGYNTPGSYYGGYYNRGYYNDGRNYRGMYRDPYRVERRRFLFRNRG